MLTVVTKEDQPDDSGGWESAAGEREQPTIPRDEAGAESAPDQPGAGERPPPEGQPQSEQPPQAAPPTDQPPRGQPPRDQPSQAQPQENRAPQEHPPQERPPEERPPQERPPGDQPPQGPPPAEQQPQEPPGGRPPQQEEPGPAQRGGASLGRRIGVFLLSLLLVSSAAGAIGIHAMQGTALSAGYVTDTMGSEGAYASLEETAEEVVIDEAQGSMGDLTQVVPGAEAIVEQTVRDVVTESYVQEEVDRNLQQTYAYLHGDAASLGLTIRTEPVIDGVSGSVSEEIQTFPIADILRQTGIKESFEGYPVDFGRVGQALKDEQTYYEVQADIRSDAQLAGVTTDDINSSVREDLNPPAEVEDSVYRVQGVITLAMTSDMSYEEFQERLDRARAAFASDAGAYGQQQISQQVPSPIDVNERLDGDTERQIQDAASAVQLFDTLALALPIIALLAIAGILWLTHSISRTSRVAGIGLAIAGLVGAVAGLVGENVVLEQVRQALANAEEVAVSTLLALVEGLFATIMTYGAAILAAGIVLIALSVVLRKYEPQQIPRSWL